MTCSEPWQLTDFGAVAYERFQVPSLFEPLARTLLAHCALQLGERILDVACGTGIVARLAAQAVGRQGHVFGVDLNTDMLEVARASTTTGDDSIIWRQGEASALPFEDGSFDLVLCQQGLQFFSERVGSLREMRRVLRPGGRLGLCVWRSIDHSPCNTACLAALTPRLGKLSAGRLRAPFALGDPEALRRLIDHAGFAEIEIHETVIMRQMRQPEISIPGHLASTPVGPEFAALNDDDRTAIVRDVAETLRPYRDRDGLAVPQGTLVVTARNAGGSAGRR